jgi:hypothetical protein
MRCSRARCRAAFPMLAELQRAFARELLAGDARLRVHRETTLGALADALETVHPVCLRLVGAEFFRALARRYARDVPSTSPDLCDYGAELGEFLERFEPARALPYLPDVARLEWALHRARHAASAAPLDPARVAALPEVRRGEASFRLAPGTALLDSPYPVDRIWETNQPGFAGDDRVCLDADPAPLVVARQPSGARFTRVSRAELELFAGFARGLALERAAAAWPGTAESLGAVLARAVEARWIA